VDIEAIEGHGSRIKQPDPQDWYVIQCDEIFAQIQLAGDDELE